MSEEISWSRLFGYRDQIHRQYREIWDLKILLVVAGALVPAPDREEA